MLIASIGFLSAISIATLIYAGIKRETDIALARAQQAVLIVLLMALGAFLSYLESEDKLSLWAVLIFAFCIGLPTVWIFSLSRAGAKIYNFGLHTWWREWPFERALTAAMLLALCLSFLDRSPSVGEIERKEIFDSAQGHYVKGDYDGCLKKLEIMAKKHPINEKALELSNFCQQGRELAGRKIDLERFEADRNARAQALLTPDRLSTLKDSLNLARNLYVQGKYQLCLQQIEILESVTPAFENSRELKTFCTQGAHLVLRQQLLETAERKAASIKKAVPAVKKMAKPAKRSKPPQRLVK